MTEYPRYKVELRHETPANPQVARGGSWFVDFYRQERAYGRWQKLNTTQGKTLSIALSALASGVKQQEREFPELAS